MPGFLATFRSRNLLFRSGVISFAANGPLYTGFESALSQTWKDQAVFFKLTAHDSFPLRKRIALVESNFETICNFNVKHQRKKERKSMQEEQY